MLYAVGVELGIGNLIIKNSIDLHGNIILGNHRLRRKIYNLLFQGHIFCNSFNKRKLYVHTNTPGGSVSAQAFNNHGPSLLNDPNIAGNNN